MFLTEREDSTKFKPNIALRFILLALVHSIDVILQSQVRNDIETIPLKAVSIDGRIYCSHFIAIYFTSIFES